MDNEEKLHVIETFEEVVFPKLNIQLTIICGMIGGSVSVVTFALSKRLAKKISKATVRVITDSIQIHDLE